MNGITERWMERYRRIKMIKTKPQDETEEEDSTWKWKHFRKLGRVWRAASAFIDSL